MSTRTAFAVVGTVVGAYFGNPALGYTIGSMVGGYVDPVKNFGPRLSDAQQQTSNDGIPIPIIYGSARIAGNVIASGPLVEHKHKDDGKGSGQVTTTYTYTRTYAIGICEGPIIGIRRVWRNAKAVFDARPLNDDGSDLSFQDRQARAAASAKFEQMATFYIGDEEQLPDAELQSIFGALKVSANRGLAYIVIKDDDLTDVAGAIPTYEFEVVTRGTSENDGNFSILSWNQGLPWGTFPEQRPLPVVDGVNYQFAAYRYGEPITAALWTSSFPDAVAQAVEQWGYTPDATAHVVGWGLALTSAGGLGYVNTLYPWEVTGGTVADNHATIMLAYTREGHTDETAHHDFYPGGSLPLCADWSEGTWVAHSDLSASSGVAKAPGDLQTPGTPQFCITPTGEEDRQLNFYGDYLIYARALPGCSNPIQDGWMLVPDAPGWAVDLLGNYHNISACSPVTGEFTQLAPIIMADADVQQIITQFPVGPVILTAAIDNTEEFWTAAYNDAVALGQLPPGWTFGSQYPVPTDEACFCSPGKIVIPNTIKLYEIVEDLCFRKGLQPSDIDVSQLVDDVVGFVVATDSTAADTINALAPGFQFDGGEWDGKLRFIKRGAGAVASITVDQNLTAGDESARVTETRAQEVEIPRKLTLSYQDPVAAYAITTQMAERYLATVNSTGQATFQIPAVLTTQQAARVADILLKDKWSSIRGTVDATLADEWSYLTPTDIVFVQSSGDAVYRVRMGPVEIQNGTFKYTGTQDLQSAYDSVATGVPPPAPSDTMDGPVGPTLAYALNLPALRDQDDQAGFYLAATGLTSGWNGALVEVSTDGGNTWSQVKNITQASQMGQLESALPAWNPDVPDDGGHVDVLITSGTLSSITREQLFNQGNGCAIGNQLLQFETATYLGDNLYRLSGLVHGRKSTPYGAQPIGTSFSMLDSLYFIPVSRSLIGRSFQMRVTSAGLSTDDGIVSTVSLNPDRSVTEWAPTNPRGARDGSGNIELSWSPRHRLGNADAPYASTWFTGYRLTVSNGVTSKVYNLSTASFSYSAAQQTDDFGSPANPLSYTIQATNSISGAGDAREATL